jgi:S-adenosylmethionine decarboxylase
MIVGTEWLIEAFDCEADSLRDAATLQDVFARIIADLGLKIVGDPHWHQFGGEAGITGLVMLTESHLACHTYPEYRTATFNLYCCRTRPEWNWQGNLSEKLDAQTVKVTKIERGEQSEFKIQDSRFKIQDSKSKNPQSAISNPKSKIVGGEV